MIHLIADMPHRDTAAIQARVNFASEHIGIHVFAAERAVQRLEEIVRPQIDFATLHKELLAVMTHSAPPKTNHEPVPPPTASHRSADSLVRSQCGMRRPVEQYHRPDT